MENITIPAGLNKIFSFAMRNLIVCASAIPLNEKKAYKNLIMKMGGNYVESLKEGKS